VESVTIFQREIEFGEIVYDCGLLCKITLTIKTITDIEIEIDIATNSLARLGMKYVHLVCPLSGCQ
jgi:hypothetical protein